MNPQGFLDNIKKFFKSKTIFANLILANMLVFALILILEVLFTVFVFENGFFIDGSAQKHLKLVIMIKFIKMPYLKQKIKVLNS